MSDMEKIKAEIERMHQQAVLDACGNHTDWLRSRIGTCVDILAFIDSLPEETCKCSLHVSRTCKENTDSLTSLEEAAEKHIHEVVDAAGHPGWNWETQDITEAFKAGAKWMTEQRDYNGREDRRIGTVDVRRY